MVQYVNNINIKNKIFDNSKKEIRRTTIKNLKYQKKISFKCF